jgi:hypothetical protein
MTPAQLKPMSPEQLSLWVAAAAVILTALAVVIGVKTLSYMCDRDLEVDSRSGWIEIHKAMVNVRVYRQLILLQGQLGMVRSNNPISSEQREKEYVLAVAQLRAQLDRLNDDPLIIALAEFLDQNKLTAQWQAESFAVAFDAFVHKVGFKARPT